MGAGWIIGGLAVAGGLGFYFYEKSKTQGSAPASPIDACNKCAGLVAARNANPGSDPQGLLNAYNHYAALCTAAGGTPPAWPG